MGITTILAIGKALLATGVASRLIKAVASGVTAVSDAVHATKTAMGVGTQPTNNDKRTDKQPAKPNSDKTKGGTNNGRS